MKISKGTMTTRKGNIINFGKHLRKVSDDMMKCKKGKEINQITIQRKLQQLIKEQKKEIKIYTQDDARQHKQEWKGNQISKCTKLLKRKVAMQAVRK